MYTLGTICSAFGSHNLLRYRKSSALLFGFISNHFLAGFKELLKKKKKSLSFGVQIGTRSSLYSNTPLKTLSSTSEKRIALDIVDW